MTPEQKEAFRREVLEEAAKVADNCHATGVMGAKVVASAVRAFAASQPAPAADTGEATGWADDAEQWGNALNKASWVFTDICPEKSSLLFNNCKLALREAILAYAAEVKYSNPTAPDAIPHAENCGRYLAEGNDGRWYYLNHANRWISYQGPVKPKHAREDERDRLYSESLDLAGYAAEFRFVVSASDFLKAKGAMLPTDRAALRQKEGGQ